MKKMILIIVFTLAPLAHLQALILTTRNIISWSDHDVLKEQDIFIDELVKTKQKNSCDQQGQPFLHALFAAELKNIQLHGSTSHSHGALKKPLLHKLFIESFDFNVTDQNGKTLLMLMAQEKDRYYNVHHGARDTYCSCSSLEFVSIMQLITFYKADVNKQDKDGFTALMHAIKNKNNITAIEIIASGACNLELEDATGKTAFMHALAQGNTTITELLINKGANINHCDKFGAPALVYMVRDKSNDVSTIQALIELGALLKLKKVPKMSNYAPWYDKKLRTFLEMFEEYYNCYENKEQLSLFLKKNELYVECFARLAALNNHHVTLDCLTEKPEHMWGILQRCAKWNKEGATEYALQKLIHFKELTPYFLDEKTSFDTRSCCCSAFCWPFFCWSMSYKTATEKFLLKKHAMKFTAREIKTERPFEMAFEATMYKKAFAHFFKNYSSYNNEKTPLLKQE